MKRHLISAADLTRDDAVLILDTAEEMARVADRPIKKLPTLRGRTVVNLFFEDSTRTRISFEAAAKRLSADVINFSAKGSSVSKGESLKDTALTLEAMGADAVVIRHGASGAPYRLATSGWIDGAVVNAGDGTHEHPTQALLDAFTMRRRLVGADAGTRPGPRRAAHHDRRRRPAQPRRPLQRPAAAHPRRRGHPGRPAHAGAGRRRDLAVRGVATTWTHVLPKSDAVMMLRVQRERMNAAFFPTEREYSRRYGLDGDRMARMPEHAIVMHPGPMNRGMEITAEVADSDRCTVVEQVANGVSHPHGRAVPAAGRQRARRSAPPTRRTEEKQVTMSKILIRGAQGARRRAAGRPDRRRDHRRGRHRAVDADGRRRSSRPRAGSCCPAWSTCTPTCASPAVRTPRPC